MDAKAELRRELASDEQMMPAVHHLETREYMGMFEYRAEDEQLLVKNLILGNCRFRFIREPPCRIYCRNSTDKPREKYDLTAGYCSESRAFVKMFQLC
jgi:hypothetical protein